MHTPATVPLLLLLPLLAPVASAGLFCTSQSQPNPIAKEYPKAVTGTINGTTAIVPVPFDVARSIIPAEYGILRDAYEALMPDFPKDMFPAELNAILDHGVQGSGISIPDFQVCVCVWEGDSFRQEQIADGWWVGGYRESRCGSRSWIA
jgi:hypothetical protein